MKFRNLFILAAAAILLCLSSCKKKETEKTYMAGTLAFTNDIPYYVMSGQKYALSGSGITAPDGTAVAYCFSNSANNKRDTVYTAPATVEFTVPDTLGTFSITCTAFPVQSSDKYYVSAESRYFVIVSDKPGTDEGSLTGWEDCSGFAPISAAWTMTPPASTCSAMRMRTAPLCKISSADTIPGKRRRKPAPRDGASLPKRIG